MNERAHEITTAIDAIDRGFGHHTAHLDAADQCAVAAKTIRRLVETIRDVSTESALELVKAKNERIAQLEKENSKLVSHVAGLVYHLPQDVEISSVLAARQAWVDLQAKAAKMEALLRRHPINSEGWVEDRDALVGTPL